MTAGGGSGVRQMRNVAGREQQGEGGGERSPGIQSRGLDAGPTSLSNRKGGGKKYVLYKSKQKRKEKRTVTPLHKKKK